MPDAAELATATGGIDAFNRRSGNPGCCPVDRFGQLVLCSSWQAGAGQTIVGISAIDGSLDWRRRNSQPFIRGIERSSRIKHGRRTSVRRSSASSPSPAVTIARPSFLSSSTYESRAVSSSSTIKTVSINSAHMRKTRAREAFPDSDNRL
jgi:hypothetical protein